MRDHKPRAQKRQEYKQVIGLLVLVLAVAAVSFGLGVSVGRRSEPAEITTAGGNGVENVSGDKQQAGPEASPEDAPKVNLTFYDTLPKGEETPLGSGINPPPEIETDEKTPEVKVAAKKVAADTGAVQKEAPAKPPQDPPKPPPVTSGEYVVQVASFQSDADAHTLQNKLLGKGHRAFLQRVDLGQKGKWTRVYVGFFGSSESAQKIADRLVAEDKLSPMVRRRQ